MSTTKYQHPSHLPKAVSIGWLRDDGDFEIVCTLRCNYPRDDSAFDGLVNAAVTALETASGLEMEVLAREDTEDTIIDYSKIDPVQHVYVYLHPHGTPRTVSFVCKDTLAFGDGEYRLVGTLYGEDILLPNEFSFVVTAIRTFLNFAVRQSTDILVRQDAPNIVEVEP